MRLQQRPLFVGQIMSIEHALVSTAGRPRIFAGHALAQLGAHSVPIIEGPHPQTVARPDDLGVPRCISTTLNARISATGSQRPTSRPASGQRSLDGIDHPSRCFGVQGPEEGRSAFFQSWRCPVAKTPTRRPKPMSPPVPRIVRRRSGTK